MPFRFMGLATVFRAMRSPWASSSAWMRGAPQRARPSSKIVRIRAAIVSCAASRAALSGAAARQA